MEQDGAGSDICGNRIDQYGHPVETILSDKLIAIGLNDVKKISLIVGISAGEEKAHSIIAGAKGKHLNTIIMDELAAIAVTGIKKLLSHAF